MSTGALDPTKTQRTAVPTRSSASDPSDGAKNAGDDAKTALLGPPPADPVSAKSSAPNVAARNPSPLKPTTVARTPAKATKTSAKAPSMARTPTSVTAGASFEAKSRTVAAKTSPRGGIVDAVCSDRPERPKPPVWNRCTRSDEIIRSDAKTVGRPATTTASPSRAPHTAIGQSARTSGKCASAKDGDVDVDDDDDADVGDLAKAPYYHGLLPRDDVEQLLLQQGDFLVRQTEINDTKTYVLSVCDGRKVRHVVLKRTSESRMWYVDKERAFPSCPDLIEYASDKRIPLGQHRVVLVRAVPRCKWQLSHDDIVLYKTLGHGAYADVYAGALKIGNLLRPCAVKQLRSITPITKDMREKFVQEARIMRKLQHPNIMRVLGIAAQTAPIMIVLEIAPNGNLRSYLRKNKTTIDGVTRARFCEEAACGLRYLAYKKMVHRDIAARNCLLDGEFMLKLSDFGLSQEAIMYRDTNLQHVPIKWLAPEVLTSKTYSCKSDVWAYGVLVWEIYENGKEPYPKMNNQEVASRVKQGDYHLPAPASQPESVSAVMLACFTGNADRRPSAKEVHTRMKDAYKEVKKAKK